MALATTSNAGEQTATQSPQASVGSAPATAQAGSVQPGTAASVLTSQGGQQLTPTSLPTVSLGTSTGTRTTATTQPVAQKHHVNPTLAGFAILLLLVAAVLFWTTSRSVKSTTKY
jgi:hypothetical protein